MWPWGHAAVGYLFLTLYFMLREDGPPGDLAALAVLIGTQFPDVIDKPLSWTFEVLPAGRTFTHSIFVTTIISAAVIWLAHRHAHSAVGIAFAIGYYSHLFADSIGPLIAGEFHYLSFLVWPLLDPPAYETEQSFMAHFANLTLSSTSVLVELALTLFVIGLWIHHGTPGVKPLRRWTAAIHSAL